ncbi:trafficking protein particle complex subunit 3-like protein, partial [Tanacetum coccineum]
NPENVRLTVLMKLQEEIDEEAILEEQILALMHRFADRFTDRRVEINNLIRSPTCRLWQLFTLTYGAIVRQLLTDLEEVEDVNKQLDQMGYNIGIRLIDEFLAKSNVTRCVDFRETAEFIAKVGFKMFLGVTASVTNWDSEGTCCSLILEDNPLVDFVELPDTCQGLYYCNILSGVVRGALEMVSMKTEITWIRDMLRGDDAFELQVKLLKQIPEEYPYKDDE